MMGFWDEAKKSAVNAVKEYYSEKRQRASLDEDGSYREERKPEKRTDTVFCQSCGFSMRFSYYADSVEEIENAQRRKEQKQCPKCGNRGFDLYRPIRR